MRRVYLDNCCYNRPFDQQNNLQIKLETEAKLFVQSLIEDRKLELIWSFILDFENSQNPFKNRKTFVDRWELKAIVNVNPSKENVSNSKNLQGLGIKKKDALHLACAIEGKADYFLTTDYLILKKRKGIKGLEILNPLEFVALYEENKR